MHSHSERRLFCTLAIVTLCTGICSANAPQTAGLTKNRAEPQVVSFSSDGLTLRGMVYKPHGTGPFPAVLYNHGSAPGLLSNEAFARLGPLFVQHGWLFFAPYRRGQGLSQSAGPYVGGEIGAAEKKGGMAAGAATMIRLLQTTQLDDQLAALRWLKQQPYVRPRNIAVAGNSFGGIETVLGAEHADYCAAIDASGGAESWTEAPALQKLMIHAVRNSRAPIFFFQAENDYDLAPSRVLAKAMQDVGKISVLKIYPPYGASPSEGHSFAYRGASVWSNDAFHFLNQHCRATSK
jgi:dienelactone hydrolase